MHKHFSDRPRQFILVFLMIVSGFLVLFYWQARQGLSLFDEGFLWYGAQRVMVGEVPMRDFMAYDIGRYYWSAAFMSLWGDNGIVGLRWASTIFQTLALYIGLAMLVRNAEKQSRIFWLLAAVTLVAWMAPQFRLFDASLPIMLIGALSFLIEQPSRQRYFLAGLVVGLVAVFGRNHGLYGVVGSLCVMAYLLSRHERDPSLISAFTAWSLGVVVGYLPVLVFLLVVPGFALAFWESLRVWFEIKATNLPLPVPWPWLVPFGRLATDEMLRSVAKGIFFIALPVFGALGIIWVIRERLQNKPISPALVASIFLTLPYAHYAYSRADLAHLGPGIPPFLMGMLALLANQPAKIKWPFAALLCGASLLVMLPAHAWWQCHHSSTQQCVDVTVVGDKLKIDTGTAANLTALNRLAAQYAPGDRSFIAAPFWPGAYAALQRKSPMWEIYVLFPRSAAFQQEEIARIKSAKPGFIVIDDLPLDGHEEMRFRNSHPIIDQYIRDNFELLPGDARNPAFQIYTDKR